MTTTDAIAVAVRATAPLASPEGLKGIGDGTLAIPPEIHEDFVMVNFREWPVADVYEGREGLRAWARESFDPVENGHFEPRGAPIAVAANVVVLPLTVRGRLKATGMELRYEFFSMHCVRDGSLVMCKGFLDEHDALAEARAWAAANP